MRIEHIDQKIEETIQPGDVVSFEFGDKLAVEGMVIETEEGLEIQLDEQGEEYITELLPLAIAAGGLAWSAYDAYQAAKAVKAGEMTKGDLAKQVGTDIALSVAGGGIAKAAGKGFNYFRKWWKKNDNVHKPAQPEPVPAPKPDTPEAPPAPVAKATNKTDAPTKKTDAPTVKKSKTKNSNKKKNRRNVNVSPTSKGSNSNLSGWLAKYGPNAQLADDVSRLRTLAGLKESYVFEGVWSVPQDMSAVAQLADLFKNPIQASSAAEKVYSLTGADDLFDDFYELEDMGPETDARPTIARWIERNMDLIADNTSEPEEVTDGLAKIIQPFIKEGPYVSEDDDRDDIPFGDGEGISNCCSASIDGEPYQGHGRCSACGEMAEIIDESKSQGDAWYIEQDAKRMAEKDGHDWSSLPYGRKSVYRDKAAEMRKGDDEDDMHDEDFYEAEYQGKKVTLNKPIRTGKDEPKKFKVYVKDGDRVKLVRFGHQGKGNEKTMKIKKSDPKRRKSFRARHNCKNPGPKTKARYWSCKAW